MSNLQQENERLKTELLAAEAEIARLESGFGDLKQWAEETISIESKDSFDMGMDLACESLINRINRITGILK
jgi:hypothetical protein